MNQLELTVQEINSLKPLEIVNHPAVRERFINIWDKLWSKGEAAYERESIFFNQILRDNQPLQRATSFSIFNAFIDLAISGLSLEPGTRALCYLIGRNTNLGTKEHPQWEGRLKLTVSGYGELAMRIRAGQIRHVDNPVLVYANDNFSFYDRDGRKAVDYTCALSHVGQPIIACYVRITRADGSIDYSVMMQEDWERLKAYSAKNNRGVANGLYGTDKEPANSGFLMAKCIKHAFRTYPKIKIGKGTELQSEQQPEQEQEIDDFYDLANTAPQEPQSFAPEPQPAAGVTVATEDDDAF